MSVDSYTLLVIIGCALVTILPRVIPFVIVRGVRLPAGLLRWLSYIPICLLSALIAQSVIRPDDPSAPIDWSQLVMLAPTALVAWLTRGLLATVLTGIAAAALVRWLW